MNEIRRILCNIFEKSLRNVTLYTLYFMRACAHNAFLYPRNFPYEFIIKRFFFFNFARRSRGMRFTREMKNPPRVYARACRSEKVEKNFASYLRAKTLFYRSPVNVYQPMRINQCVVSFNE